MPALDIATVARRSGIPASALRHYETKGLVRPIGRHGLRRVYDADVLERLALVALGRAAGFSLDEIAAMLGTTGRPTIDRVALARRADEVERTIAGLVALRDSLRHAAACRAPSHLECPSFRRLMREATARATAPRAAARRRPARR